MPAPIRRRDLVMASVFLPGMFVRHPHRPDWGRGQVQSAIGNRVTVNFEDAGKQTINIDNVPLVLADDEDGKGA